MASIHVVMCAWAVLGILTIPFYKPEPHVWPMSLLYGGTLWIIMLFDTAPAQKGGE